LSSTVVPRPSRLAIAIAPPCSCMIDCEIERPSPVPWDFVEKNGSNRLGNT
jgi:hypothetical protein